MRLIVSVAAGIWLFAVGAQGLAFLVKYGILPGLPPEIGQLDFTPQYTLLAILLVVASVAARLRFVKITITENTMREITREREGKRGGQT